MLSIAVLAIVVIVAVPALIFLAIYNSLVGRKNQVENVFASIDALLKKRTDLIPNLVASVKEYMGHEAGVITKVTELRAKATSGALTPDEQLSVNKELGQALRGLMVSVEAYPNLKANENFLQLQASLNEVEEQLSAARRAFNASVTDYNNAVEMFPSNIVAGMIGYQRRQLFEITDEERKTPHVKEMLQS